MNTSILRKCLEELSKSIPDISYVRGMLETLLEVSEGANMVRDLRHLGATIGTSSTPGSYFPPTAKIVSADSPQGQAVEAALASINGMPQPKQGIQETNITLN